MRDRECAEEGEERGSEAECAPDGESWVVNTLSPHTAGVKLSIVGLGPDAEQLSHLGLGEFEISCDLERAGLRLDLPRTHQIPSGDRHRQ